MSVQVQLRRDTLANVLANHGALGEVYVSTDSKELFVQDGATAGGFRASGARGPFGSFTQLAVAESIGATGETLTTGVTTYTTALQLPAGYKFIMGAGWRVGTTITGPTGTFNFGVSGAATYFASAQSPSLTAGSTVIYTGTLLRFDAAPISLLLTSNTGNFTAGAVRFVVNYILLSPPTS
jgi:Major tropism determinant N-terminal domain